MAEGLNRVTLLGNLGADGDLRFTQSGTAVLNLRLATTERYKAQDGEWKERTDWHSVVVWGKRGEALAKFLQKGATVCVEGSLRTSSYEKDGQKRYKTEVIAREVILCGGRGERSGQRAPDPDFGQDHANDGRTSVGVPGDPIPFGDDAPTPF